MSVMFLGEIIQRIRYRCAVIRLIDLPVNLAAEKPAPLMIEMLRFARRQTAIITRTPIWLQTTIAVFEKSCSLFFGHGYPPNLVAE
jgi:hypothetical protein